ncbi:hypothetical protein B0H11DRAFT_1911846 [Mycena galericulata]|nr:hypothetical protein B0H11DRAFT_1911846 [Mycena galericulata]
MAHLSGNGFHQDFFDQPDPTHGLVNYQNAQDAQDLNLAIVEGRNMILAVDNTTALLPGQNRNSSQICTTTAMARQCREESRSIKPLFAQTQFKYYLHSDGDTCIETSAISVRAGARDVGGLVILSKTLWGPVYSPYSVFALIPGGSTVQIWV